MKSSQLTGTGVALVTPFDERNRIDFDALKEIMVHVEEGGVDYLVILGTTSEAPTLSREEKRLVQEFVIKHNDSRLPIVLGLGGNHTAELENRLKSDNLEGIDAILTVAPYYNRPTQQGIIEHFTHAADASPLPLVLYNVPARTSSNISFESTLELAEHENIMGIKEASCDMNQCARIAAAMPKDFLLIAGDDMHCMPIMSLGGAGVISVIANAFPAQIGQSVKDYLAGESGQATVAFLRLAEMVDLIFEEGSPAGIKALLREMNLCAPNVRLPLAQATEGLMQRIAEANEKIGQ